VFEELASISRSIGQRGLLVLGLENEDTLQLVDRLAADGIQTLQTTVKGEPTVKSVQAALDSAENFSPDFVIGMGGGSAIDTAKAVSILMMNPGNVLDYLEVIGAGKTLSNPALPCIGVPTTAGTGAEVTRNAVIASPEDRVKVSLRSPYLLPRVALIDPALTLTLPPSVTASTGLDAFTQVIEPFVSHQANPITDVFCVEGIRRVARSILKAYRNGKDIQAREDMSLASLFGGLALANAKLGAVHGFAGVIGGMFHGPHGVICARLLPIVISENVRALQERDPHSLALQRYQEVARLITGDQNARLEDGLAWIENVCRELSVPSLSDIGMRTGDIPEVAEKSSRSSSMKGNPILLNKNELYAILETAM
jgi:alcohol dehydrogenase class IV